jgi:hypothetical protein
MSLKPVAPKTAATEAQYNPVPRSLRDLHLNVAKIKGHIEYDNNNDPVVVFSVPVQPIPIDEIYTALKNAGIERAGLYTDELAQKIEEDSIAAFLAKAVE